MAIILKNSYEALEDSLQFVANSEDNFSSSDEDNLYLDYEGTSYLVYKMKEKFIRVPHEVMINIDNDVIEKTTSGYYLLTMKVGETKRLTSYTDIDYDNYINMMMYETMPLSDDGTTYDLNPSDSVYNVNYNNTLSYYGLTNNIFYTASNDTVTVEPYPYTIIQANKVGEANVFVIPASNTFLTQLIHVSVIE